MVNFLMLQFLGIILFVSFESVYFPFTYSADSIHKAFGYLASIAFIVVFMHKVSLQ